MTSYHEPAYASELLLKQLHDQIETIIKETYENINRMEPVRLSTLKTPSEKKKDKSSDTWDVVSVPTKAELDYQQNGLTLPKKIKNLEKLLADFERTGKFDYELCYLLRKQEAQDELRTWIDRVIQKRKLGDEDFGRDSDPHRFNNLVESVEMRVKDKQLFRAAFLRSLSEPALN
jgi:hypothetical protein